MADRNVKVILAASVEGFTAALGRAKASVETLGAATAKASQTEGWRRAGTAMIGLGAAAMAGVAMAVRASASFEQSMAEVAATGEEARGQIAGLRKAALDAGRDTAFSATEAADGITALAKAGVSTADILSGGLRGALNLAASGQLSVADAAETTSAALVQFKLKGKDAGHVADLLAAGAGKAMGSVGDMGQALKQSGVVASQFGVSIEETVGTLAAFASTGMIGAEAGTGFKSMLLALAKPSREAQRAMDELGISAYDAEGQFVGITNLAGQLKDKLGDLTVEQRQAALSTIFGSFAIRNASVLYEQGAEGIQQWVDNVNDSGYAARVAAGLLDNLNGDLQVLGGSWETLLIKMGTDAQAPLRSVVQWLTELINAVAEHPTMAASVLKLLAAFGGFALAAGLIMKATTAAVEFRTALLALQAAQPKFIGALGAMGRAAGAVGLAFVALEVASMVFEKVRVGQPTLEQTLR
ncbi:phage tail tape measure protein [Collinsella sp. LCP21S3_D3]|uniref:phage tail tape measure protein n=1 Tax=Collinsella sp. LCP21S3_D3 TaxID=3438773 RepID=UPI003F90C3DD